MARLDKDLFEAHVREHHAAVYRSAFRLLREPADAADAAQEVFVRLFAGKVRLEQARSVRATLCWLATRLASNQLRARRRRRDHEENAMHESTDRAENRDDPATLSADADLHRTVRELVGTLPHDLQLPLQMRCQDELTFAAIGTALRLPESTVHDRFQQALQRLRTALATRGFAVATAGVPALVASTESVALPTDLQARLLALPGTAVAGTSAIVQKFAFGVALVAVTAIAVLVDPWSPRTAGEPGATVVAAVASPREADLPQDPPATERTTAAADARTPVVALPSVQEGSATVVLSTFRGTVHDAAAWPVGGVEVAAVAAGGLKAFDLGTTTTDQHGAFCLVVDPSHLHPSHIRLRVVEGSHLLLETDELALPRASDAPPLALVVPADQGLATTRYELRVAVHGDDGVPLSGVAVALRATAAPDPSGVPEASGDTGLDGVVVLSGRKLGEKRLFVDGRPLGRRSHHGAIVLDRTGAHETQVSLAMGRVLQVRIGTVAGTPIEWANVSLEDDATGLQHSGAPATDGTFRMTGLGAGTYTLLVTSSYDLSPCLRRGVRAQDEPVVVTLKARRDVRDVGDHMAELHGELVDAATGAVVPYTGFQVDVLPWRDGESTLPSDRLVPRGPVQQMEFGGSLTTFCEVGLEAGRHALVVEVPGYAATVVEFDLRDGEMRTGLRVPLQRGCELRGRVFSADGTPAARALVFVVGTGALANERLARWRALDDEERGRAADPTHLLGTAWTGDDGSFVLRDVPSGVALRLVARQGDRGFGVTPVPVGAAGHPIGGLEVRLEPR